MSRHSPLTDHGPWHGARRERTRRSLSSGKRPWSLEDFKLKYSAVLLALRYARAEPRSTSGRPLPQGAAPIGMAAGVAAGAGPAAGGGPEGPSDARAGGEKAAPGERGRAGGEEAAAGGERPRRRLCALALFAILLRHAATVVRRPWPCARCSCVALIRACQGRDLGPPTTREGGTAMRPALRTRTQGTCRGARGGRSLPTPARGGAAGGATRRG